MTTRARPDRIAAPAWDAVEPTDAAAPHAGVTLMAGGRAGLLCEPDLVVEGSGATARVVPALTDAALAQWCALLAVAPRLWDALVRTADALDAALAGELITTRAEDRRALEAALADARRFIAGAGRAGRAAGGAP